MPTMSDYLAWSTSTTLTITWPQLAPLPNQVFTDVVTVPALTGLGPLPVLSWCLSWRIDRVPFTEGFNFRYYPTLDLAGATIPPDLHQQTAGGFFQSGNLTVGLRGSGLSWGYWRHALAAGGPVDITFDLLFGATPMGSGMVFHGLFAFALFRDLQAQPEFDDPFEGEAGAAGIGPTEGGGPLDVTVSDNWFSSTKPPVDPAPAEVIYSYAWDTHTSTPAASVTGETHAGWEDAISVTSGTRAALIGLYIPASPPELVGTISGAPTADVGGQQVFLVTYSPKAPTPLAPVPSRLATIVG